MAYHNIRNATGFAFCFRGATEPSGNYSILGVSPALKQRGTARHLSVLRAIADEQH